jgi:LacI family transcriptional regulator
MQPKTSAVTVRHVAARAGVSQSTVSNVLNRPHAVAPDTLARVTAAIAELGFVRNDAARALRLGESQAVGIVVSEASSPYYAEVVQAAGVTLAAAGYSSLLGNSVQQRQVEGNLISLFEAQRVRGLLLAPVGGPPRELEAFEGRGVDVVYVDARAPRDDQCSVEVDHELGGEMAVRHLYSLGRRRLAIVRGPVELPQIAQRVRGAKRAAAALGLESEEIAISNYFVEGGSEAAAVLTSRPARRRPDGVFATNDLLAMGLVSRLIDGGVSVPGDIAVVGYDDIAMAAVARVPLTTLRQPARDIGSRAAALLVEELSEDGERPPTHQHEHTVFQPELVVRASTVPRNI